MPNIREVRETKYIIELSVEEASYLKGLLQNQLNETTEHRKMRKDLFTALNEKV